MASKKGRGTEQERGKENVSNRILTVPNVISIVRLCLVPVFLVLLFNGYDLMATFLFALAAGTDWVDGQIARRTNAVSRLGQLLDPAVDRILMIAGVAGLFLVGRLPLWIIVVVLARDLALLVGGAAILKRFHVRVAVIYLGKVATTFLFVGFAALLLNWPVLNGLGVVDASWLPGLSAEPYSWGIWFVYAGLVLALITTAYYVAAALVKVRAAKREAAAQPERR
ncbi:CDP-alcohol phosphatidyltransferase [Gordonibacter sp. 28C]|uniref:CDP-alcohol phosphatidyltransferase family protein n=1 Tax=Gordonibacter sp. 28C TaxID=2078569 RepID=UPI000DF74167|nr:CDP-alcohol phosphatidyltransferase family protein [Gordonibacter sp. 28C]RDB62403.1 CDP-alcohol phosphatidyltransferase [Gordonibacter sp. 28C]